MDQARAEKEWGQVASVMALLANCHRDPKRSAPFRPDDFNPYRRGRRLKSGRLPVSAAEFKRMVFGDN